MFLEIGLSQKPAVLLHESIDFVGDLSAIKRVASLLPDSAQRILQSRILEHVSFAGSATFPIQGVGFEKSAGEPFIESRTEPPIVGNQFGDRESFVGITNGRRE